MGSLARPVSKNALRYMRFKQAHDALKCMANPVVWDVLKTLSNYPNGLSVNNIVANIRYNLVEKGSMSRIDQSRCSTALSRLRTYRIVQFKRMGKHKLYRIDRTRFKALYDLIVAINTLPDKN